MSSGVPEITQGEAAGVTETSADGLTPPGAPTSAPGQVPLSPQEEIEGLDRFLRTRFPGERERTNRQVPETAVQTAVRLLQALAARTPPTLVQRCQEEFCNQPAGHRGLHGWVHAD